MDNLMKDEKTFTLTKRYI